MRIYFENVAIFLANLLCHLPDVQLLYLRLAQDISDNAVQALKMSFISRCTPPELLCHVIPCAEWQNSELDQSQVYFVPELLKEICERAISPHNHQNNSTATHSLFYFGKCNLFLFFVNHVENMAACFSVI